MEAIFVFLSVINQQGAYLRSLSKT